jgi:hypothetical protein
MAAAHGAERTRSEPSLEIAIMNSFRISALLGALALGFAAAPASAQIITGPVPYVLDTASDYTHGCYPPCLCPLMFNPNLVGTFTLHFTSADPAGFVHYDVLNVDMFLGTTNPDHITGSGHYRHGGQVAILEEMDLDLSVNGAAPEHFDSGLVAAAAVFPQIDISVSMNGMVCLDTVYHIVAAPGEAGMGFCFGDGSGTACPCGNNGTSGYGCANSINTSGANVLGTGTASLSADDVVLDASGLPNASALFFQGTQRINGGAGVVFGDGLRCAGGTVRRLRTVLASNGEAQVPGPSDPSLSSMGGITAPGTFQYQVWYRNAAAFCTPNTFNLTNGYEIQWTP